MVRRHRLECRPVRRQGSDTRQVQRRGARRHHQLGRRSDAFRLSQPGARGRHRDRVQGRNKTLQATVASIASSVDPNNNLNNL